MARLVPAWCPLGAQALVPALETALETTLETTLETALERVAIGLGGPTGARLVPARCPSPGARSRDRS